MKRRIICLLCVLLIGIGDILAQKELFPMQLNRNTTVKKNTISGDESENKNKGAKIQSKKWRKGFNASDRLARVQNPAELYAHISKKYGWYMGIGKKLTKQQAGKLPFCYRLSGKDNHGHFTRVEALSIAENAEEKYTCSHDVSTHLSHSVTAHSVQWLLDDDSDGNVIQESGYDAQGNLIYTYHSTRLPNGDILGHYTDQYGQPIGLQNDGSSEDKYIQVVFDSVGRESVVNFLGENLHIQRNEETNAYGIRYVYGEYDSIVRIDLLDYRGEIVNTDVDSVEIDSMIGIPFIEEEIIHKDSVSTKAVSTIALSKRGKTVAEQTRDSTVRFGRDALSHHARTHQEEYFYYQARCGYTYHGDLAYMIGSNEYGEPSYITGSEYSGAPIYWKGIYGEQGIFFDEDNNEIPTDSMKTFRSGLGKAYYVEILTERAYDAGLRSGDMIVRYAGFYYPTVQTDFWQYANELQAQIYMSRETEKDIFVLRYDSTEETHVIQQVHLPKGTAGQIGFHFIMGCLTKKEAARYDDAVQRYLEEHDMKEISDGKDYSTITGYKKLSILRPYKIDVAEMPTWQNGLHEDAIVVAAQVIDSQGNTQTFISSQNGCVLNEIEYDEKTDTLIIYYTTDGEKLQSTKLENAYFITSYDFPKNEYDNILLLEKQLPQSAFRREE